jgi:outer membrane usher protein
MLLASPLHAESANAPAFMQPALLGVSVNGQDQGDPVAVIRTTDGGVLIPRAAWAAWRLKNAGLRETIVEGDSYLSLKDIRGVRFRLDDATQTLALTIPPELFGASRLNLAGPALQPMTASRAGGFLNYDVLAERSAGRSSLNAALELGVFAHGGVGLNTMVGGWHDGRMSLVRLDTNWTIDDPARRRSLRLGDSISGGGVGGTPVRFGGIQFGSNFAVEPGYITQPLPTIRGSAALPSVVDIYINNNLAGRRDVAPGPFSITDLPVVTGGGDVQLIVRDTLGRETLVTQSYYAAPQLLRAGLSSYSYEVGFLRRDYAVSSNDYGPLMASATHRIGISDALTAEVHAEATRSVQQVGASATIALVGIGAFSASGAASRGPDGTGALAGVAFEHRTPWLSLGATAEYATERYTSVGFARDYRRGALNAQAFVGMPVSFGSVGLSYLRRDSRDQPDIELIGANATVRLPKGALHITARQSLLDRRDTAIQLFFTLPLGQQASASTSVQYQSGQSTLEADIQRNLPVGEGIGYRASVSTGAVRRIDGVLSAQTSTGNYQIEVVNTNGQSGVRVGASGGIGLVGGNVFASRTLSQSFAVVHVGHFKGVRVYVDNQLVGKTNGAGVAVLPRLRPFDRNNIRIELGDLPLDTRVTGGELSVRPYNRSGVLVDFQARRERSATLTVRLEDGTALPDGAAVRVEGTTGDFVSAPGGDLYLSGLRDRNVVSAHWGGKSCSFSLDLPPSREVQPELGQHVCHAETP